MAQDPLTIDVSQDLERIDAAMTRLILDEDLSKKFKLDPNGVMVQLGMHPATTSEVTDRVNRTFYAAVTNRELTAFVEEQYRSFAPPNASDALEFHRKGLEEGRIQNRLEYDLAGADHLLKQPAALTKIFNLLLNDLNEKHILTKEYRTQDIATFVDQLVEAISQRRPIREHPKLEAWDRNYGIGGFHYGAEAVEVGPVVTVYTGVEIGLFVTVAIRAAQVPDERMISEAASGDPRAVRRLAMTAKIVHFSADLLLHAQQFEARRNR